MPIAFAAARAHFSAHTLSTAAAARTGSLSVTRRWAPSTASVAGWRLGDSGEKAASGQVEAADSVTLSERLFDLVKSRSTCVVKLFCATPQRCWNMRPASPMPASPPDRYPVTRRPGPPTRPPPAEPDLRSNSPPSRTSSARRAGRIRHPVRSRSRHGPFNMQRLPQSPGPIAARHWLALAPHGTQPAATPGTSPSGRCDQRGTRDYSDSRTKTAHRRRASRSSAFRQRLR